MNHQAAVDREFRRGQTRAFWGAFPVFMLGFLVAAAFGVPTFLAILFSGIPAVIVYYLKLRGSFNTDNVICDGEQSGDVRTSGPAPLLTSQTKAPPTTAQLSTIGRTGRLSVFCTNCGTESPDDSRFCSKCGTGLVAMEAVPTRERREAVMSSRPYVRRLLELSDNLAASFVVFSGKQSVGESPTPHDVAFETVFDMIHPGFPPSYGLSAEVSLWSPGEDEVLDEKRKQYDPTFIEATTAEIRKDELFDPAFRDATAFLCFCMNEFSRTTMNSHVELLMD